MKRHQTLRRGLSILLSLVLCLSLLPATALAAATATADFTSGDGSAALTLLGGAAKADWNSGTKTLTLKGVNFSTTNPTAVKLPAGATIVLAENTENTIASVYNDLNESYGIYAEDGLTIQGGGTLTVTGGESTGLYNISFGIYTEKGDVTISGGTVVATGGTAGQYSCGIYALSGDVRISGESTVVTAAGGWSSGASSGISGVNITVLSGTVTALGGMAASLGVSQSSGISADRDVTISGGTVVATGGTADDGGDPDGTAYSQSCGISANFDITISGVSVTATGGDADDQSCGISGGSITISGREVTARTLAGEETKKRMALDKAPDLSAYVSYDWRTSPEGGSTSSTDTPYAYNETHTYVEFSNGITVTTYTVTFDANGGSGEMAAKTTTGSYTLPDCTFMAPEGKQFKAWSVNGTEYAAGASITVSADTTVTAVWKNIPAATDVEINAKNFPDAIFREQYVRGYDTDGNGWLSAEEIAAVTEINCWEKGITDLTGIEYFTELKKLVCSDNLLATLDVSNNKKLDLLACGDNLLTELNVESNTALTFLNCANNLLTELNLSNNTALATLFCEENQLTVLDVSKHTALRSLDCYYNQLTSLDLTNTSIVSLLYAHGNSYEIEVNDDGEFALSTLPGNFDVSKASNWNGGELSADRTTLTVNPDVAKVTYDYDCGKNETVTFTLRIKGASGNGDGIAINDQNFPDIVFRRRVFTFDTNNDDALNEAEIAAVKEIDVYGSDVRDLTGIAYFTALEDLDCAGNFLTELDISSNQALKNLDCGGNDLTTLDVSENTNLEELRCFGNDLTELDLSNNTALTYLDCSDTQLTELALSKNTALTQLVCYNNRLTSLDLISTRVTSLSASDNIYAITLGEDRTFDLTKLPGKFDVSKASSWQGGTPVGNILKVDSNATQVTYSYDCGRNQTVTFTLEVVSYIITVSSSGGALSVAVAGLDAGEEATIVAAQYNGARMVDVRTASVTGTGGNIARDFDFTASRGDSYKVFLLSSASAPLCEAKSTT